jgi:hypothetical protein
MIGIAKVMYQEIEASGRKVFGVDLFVQFWTKATDMNLL